MIVKKNVRRFPKLFQRKKAFTIAELLITIVIVGLVSVLIIPFFISKIQDLVRAKRIENIEQKFSKATDKMLVSSGMEGYNSTESFVNELSKHLSIVQICNNNNLSSCWPTDTITLNNGKKWDISNTTTGKTLKMPSDENNEWDNTMGIITADGTCFIMSYNKKCAISQTIFPSWIGSKSSSTNCVAAIYDWNGSSKPNTFGLTTSEKNDIIPFNANGLGNECSIEVNGKCFGAFFKPTPPTISECSNLQNLGLVDNCAYNGDYFAGAVKQCGGKDNMPSIVDLHALKDELRKGDWENNTKNLGLPPEFSVWSSHEGNIGYSADYYSYFPEGNNGYSITTMDRTNRSSTYGVCIIN